MLQHPAGEAEQFAPGVEADLPVAGMQRMPMEYPDPAPAAARQRFQAPEKIEFLRCIEFLAEAADCGKRSALAEDEGPGAPPADAADRVPDPDCQPEAGVVAVRGDGAAAGQAGAAFDRRPEVAEQTRAGRRVRVDEHQPLSIRDRGTAVARAGNLVVRLEHDPRTRSAGDFRRAVGGVVVANDEFPARGIVERLRRRLDAFERRAEQALFVERRDDDGKLQARSLNRWIFPVAVFGSSAANSIQRGYL